MTFEINNQTNRSVRQLDEATFDKATQQYCVRTGIDGVWINTPIAFPIRVGLTTATYGYICYPQGGVVSTIRADGAKSDFTKDKSKIEQPVEPGGLTRAGKPAKWQKAMRVVIIDANEVKYSLRVAETDVMVWLEQYKPHGKIIIYEKEEGEEYDEFAIQTSVTENWVAMSSSGVVL